MESEATDGVQPHGQWQGLWASSSERPCGGQGEKGAGERQGTMLGCWLFQTPSSMAEFSIGRWVGLGRCAEGPVYVLVTRTCEGPHLEKE